MTMLWPESDQIAAQKRLRQTLYLLRKAIPAIESQDETSTVPLLLTDRQTVQINPLGRYQLDVALFKKIVSEKKDSWHEAEALYQGEFLADFYLPDNNLFEEWVNLERANLSRLYMKTLAALADDAIANGAYPRAQQYARRQLQVDNLAEPAQRQLMTSLALDGQRREALIEHQAFSQLLEHELGLSCTQETETLVQSIREGTLVPVRYRSGTSMTLRQMDDKDDPPYPIFNLPQSTSAFIGRETELADLESRFSRPEVRLLTISGPGGMGKTSLALAYAQTRVAYAAQLENQFTDGTVFVDMAPLDHVDRLLAALAEALELQLLGAREQSPKAQILDFLRLRKLLLIMDNFEHLLESVHLLSEILQAAPDVKILVTSRERLRLREEHVFPLQGLKLPTSESASELAHSSAVKLFQLAARRVQPQFTINEQNLNQVIQICQQVEGLPLGIELAASWVDTLTPTRIASELQQNLAILESDLINIPDRQQSIHAVFDTSWQRLNQEQRQTFAQLSIFRGGFTRRALQAVTGASFRLISQLVSKSLLSLDMDNDRYHVHELLRQYGSEKLADWAAERDLFAYTSNRHAAYYTEFLQQQGDHLQGAKQDEAARAIEVDIGNCRLAWEWAVKNASWSLLRKAAFGLLTFLEWRALYQEGQNACESATSRMHNPGSLDEQRLAAWLLAWQGHFCTLLDQNDEADQLLRRSQAFLQNPAQEGADTRFERCEMQRRLGDLAYFSDVEKSLHHYRQSLALARSLEDTWSIAELNYRIGDVYIVQGNYKEVERYLRVSLMGFEHLGDQRHAVNVQRALSLAANHQGNYREAEQLMQGVLETVRVMGNRHLEASVHGSMSMNLSDQGEFDKSLPMAEECYRLSLRLGVPAQINGGSTALGSVKIHLGHYEEAQQLLEQVQHRFVGGLWHAFCLQSLGMMALVRGEVNQAVILFNQSANMYRSFRNMRMIASILSYQVLAFVTQKQMGRARDRLADALESALSVGIEIRAAQVLAAAAVLAEGEGDQERAVQLYSRAKLFPYVGNSKWYADVAGKRIAAAAEILPQEKKFSARSQDQQSDLMEMIAQLNDEYSK